MARFYQRRQVVAEAVTAEEAAGEAAAEEQVAGVERHLLALRGAAQQHAPTASDAAALERVPLQAEAT